MVFALCSYVKAYRKISRIIDMMAWFGLKEWQFAHRNIDELNELLPAEERSVLQFNIATINWSEYFRSYLSGIRRYFFKDSANDNKLQQRKTIYRRWVWLSRWAEWLENKIGGGPWSFAK